MITSADTGKCTTSTMVASVGRFFHEDGYVNDDAVEAAASDLIADALRSTKPE